MVALLLVIALTIMGYNFAQLKEANDLVTHTEQVKSSLNGLRVTLLEIQVSMRDFSRNRSETLFRTYQDNIASGERQIQQIRRLVSDNAEQLRRMDELQLLLQQDLVFRTRVINLARLEGSQAAERLIDSQEGTQTMARVQAKIKEMLNTEEKLLSVRVTDSFAFDRLARGTLAFLSGLVIVLLFSGALLIQRQFAERRQREAATEQARLYAESIVESLREPLLVLTSTLRVRSANGAFYRVFQCRPEDTKDRLIYQVSNEEWDLPPLRDLLENVLPKVTEVNDFELAHTFPRTGYRVMLINVRKIRRPENAEVLILLVMEDITERKLSEIELRKLNSDLNKRSSELAAINRELEAFSYSVSHDLRAPIRHVAGYIDLLRRALGNTLEGAAVRYLKNIGDSARHMGTLVDELLAFSRMGRQEMRQSPVNLNELIDDLLGRELHADTQGRVIHWKVETLPLVRADAAMVRLALMNLLSNALKYSRTRSEARIEIGSQPGTGGQKVIYVRDNGVGFDMGYIDKLFGVFQRLHRAEEFEGTGIGLANVRRIIDRHGGRVWAESVLGEGAVFYFSLSAVVV